MVRIERFDDARPFYERAAPFLERREAQHTVQLGWRDALEDDLFVFGPERPYLAAAVGDGGEVVAVATRTPPHNLVLSAVDDLRAIDALIADLDGAPLPGLLAPVDVGTVFVERWPAKATVALEQRIYQATALIPPRPTEGGVRAYTEDDHALIVEWMNAFYAEAMPNNPEGDGEEFLRRREGRAGELLLWEVEGRPVSFAGYASPSPNGMRVGPVYTPPELRGRGYASAVTAAATERVLASGRRFCFLSTDLANPTSNSIYQQIGFEPVVDVTVWHFA
jgi:predicted GNAT family acetyltransferase